MTKTIEQARREAFEAIFTAPPYEFHIGRYTGDSASWPGNYAGYHVECAWQAYNAALDSLCIELPFMRYYCGASGESEMAYAPEDIEQAIHAAGVKTR